MPVEHPWQMLDGLGLEHTMESEQVLTWMLIQCIEAGEFRPVETKYRYPQLVKANLLVQVDTEIPIKYILTKKAIGLLYGYFGKEQL